MTLTQRLLQILIALDQLSNTLIGLFFGDGWADESISAKAYRLRRDSIMWKGVYKVVNALFFWQQNHCKASYMSELKARHLPPEYRKLIK